MSVQNYKDKVEVWVSKLGGQYRQDEIDFTATKSELDRIRNLPENRRCADCGMDHGNAWASVNIGVFTCIRCGSFHRALGTHISKPKGCTGTYLWGVDEVKRMKDIGNERANQLYGGKEALKHLPSPDATHDQWLQYFKDKYIKRRWAEEADVKCQSTKLHTVATEDLLGLHTAQPASSSVPSKQSTSQDFFAQFDL